MQTAEKIPDELLDVVRAARAVLEAVNLRDGIIARAALQDALKALDARS